MVLIIPKDDYIKLMEKDFSLVRGTMSDQERKMWRLFHQLKNTVGNIYMERKLYDHLVKFCLHTSYNAEENMERYARYMSEADQRQGGIIFIFVFPGA